jgi:hypothetical protein
MDCDEIASAWSPPTQTEIPDALAKSALGQLPTGEIFLLGNQTKKKKGMGRDPLSVAIANEDIQFTRVFAIRAGALKFQVPAQQSLPDGRGTGFQYP